MQIIIQQQYQFSQTQRHKTHTYLIISVHQECGHSLPGSSAQDLSQDCNQGLTRTEISSESSTGDGSTFKAPQFADRIIFFVAGHKFMVFWFLKPATERFQEDSRKTGQIYDHGHVIVYILSPSLYILLVISKSQALLIFKERGL